MDLRITLEWDYEAGISLEEMYPFREGLEKEFTSKSYGSSIDHIWIVLTCRSFDFKQRKRYKKSELRLEYDILLDYYLVKNVFLDDKKQLIKYKFFDVSEKTLEKYKFPDFDNRGFLTDLKSALHTLEW